MKTLLVSCFFDIGRDKIDIKGMRRSASEYFEYFEVWARMKNELIVYTQEEYVDQIYEIRRNFGLELTI